MAHSMTAKWVERVKEEDSVRQDYYDSVVVGLGLRVSRTGKKVWFVKSRTRGSTKSWRLTLGPYPSVSLADARDAAKAELLKAGRGENPAAKKQEQKGAITIEDLADQYIERHAKVFKRSWKKDRQALDSTVVPAWRGRKAAEINRNDVRVLLEHKIREGSPIQANRLLALIKKVFNWAVYDVELLEANPFHKMKMPAPENPRDRVLSEAELKALWRAIESYGGTITPMFKFRILTAQRGGEVAAMRWDEVDLDAGWWTIPAGRVKNKLSHRVPLSEPARAILRELRHRRDAKDGGWVFRGKRIGQPFKHIGEPTKVLRERSGVAFVPHDLRRTASTYMAGMGISRLVVSKILNHAEAGITRVYDRHSYDQEKREALDAWAERLMLIVAATPVNA